MAISAPLLRQFAALHAKIFFSPEHQAQAWELLQSRGLGQTSLTILWAIVQVLESQGTRLKGVAPAGDSERKLAAVVFSQPKGQPD